MLNIPDWANNFMRRKECPYCHGAMGQSVIVQVGIKLHNGEKPCLYYESSCNFCGKISHTTIFTDADLSPYQLAAEIYNSYDSEDVIVQHSKVGNSKNKKSKFKAFDKEFSNLKIFMSKNDNYVEFLKYIGLTDTEIDLYGKWDPQDDENIS